MTNIQLTLTGAQAKADVDGILTAGMVGIPVVIDYDSQWEDLVKTLVCSSGVATVSIENVGTEATIPSGVIQWGDLACNQLFLGVEGRNAKGDLVIPSTMAYCGKILPSAHFEKNDAIIVNPSTPSAQAAQTVTWHQCPEPVRRFLAQVSYDPADGKTSNIAEYAPVKPDPANSKPIQKKIGTKTFCNEVPKARTPFVAGSYYGVVKPLDQIRYIGTVDAPNVRDLGGWACDGGKIKYGLLFRGGQPTINDRSVLVDQLGIHHELDLRGSETTATTSPLGDDVYYTRSARYNWYSLVNTENWKENLACIFNAVTHGLPVFFHCTAGADRTGTLACLLEGLLGVSRSDIDKDYELTCFYTGTGTDTQARRRNEAEWQSLISALNGYAGDSFRDKCISFVTALGFTKEQINAYRAAMIDGTPEIISPNVSQLGVTQILDEGIFSDNDVPHVTQFQPYTAAITCQSGVIIQSVRVTMEGKDVTSTSWQGLLTNLTHEVSLQLENCNASNELRKVIDGQGYVTSIIANEGYTLKDAQVTILMGGKNVSNYYSGGVIAIPQVTGKLEITIRAASAAPTTVNQMNVQQGNLNKRISGSSAVAFAGCFVSDPIAVDLSAACTVTLKGFASKLNAVYDQSDDIFGQSKVAFLDSNQAILGFARLGKVLRDRWILTAGGEDYSGNLSLALSIAGLSADQVQYVQFAPHISSSTLSTSDLSGLEILMPVL